MARRQAFSGNKKANHDLLLEEERRLFYVAITRAKEKLFLMTLKGSESSFLKEIPDIYTVKTSIPIKSVVEKIITCDKCFSQLEKLFTFALTAGKEQVNDKTEIAPEPERDQNLKVYRYYRRNVVLPDLITGAAGFHSAIFYPGSYANLNDRYRCTV